MVVDTVFLEKGLKAAFDEAYAQFITDPYAKLADILSTEVPSTSASEKYGWLGDLPAVQEWLGDKVAGTLTDYNFTIVNKDWYSAIDIDRNELDDDQLGRILPRVQMLAQRMKAYRGALIALLIVNSLVSLAYDGAAYFANRAAPNDNLLAGTGVTLATLLVDIAAARAAMFEFQTDQGVPMGCEMDTIVCPPAIEGVMLQACRSAVAAPVLTGITYNPPQQWIKNVIVLPGLADVNDWYGFASGYAIKPFIYQNRKAPDLVLDDTQVKKNRKLIYSAEARGNAGYGLFQMGIRTVN